MALFHSLLWLNNIPFPEGSVVKNLPAMWETWVWSLGQEDPMEKGMATHSSVLAWRISWTEEPDGLQSIGLQSWTQLSNLYLTSHYIFLPHLLYPFLCWWTFRLLPCLGCCKQCFSEHWGACIFLNYGFLWTCAQEWDCWVIWKFRFRFLRNLHTVLYNAPIYISTNRVGESPFLHTLSSIYCL